jgi:hypothetical protein
MERKRAFMSDEVWAAILHRYVVPYRFHNLHCPPTFIGHKDGEPLLNKRLPDRLRDLAAAAPDMTVDIYSHGLMLPKWNARGEDFLTFLGTLPNRVRYMMSYHPRNHDDSTNDYRPVVDYLRWVFAKGPPRNVEFITVSHQSRWVSPEMQEAWKKQWEGMPITVHCNTHINPWTGRMEDIATCHYHGCPYSDFGHWFFGATGNVIACCLDLEEEIVLGNVLKDDPAEMFARTAAFYAAQRETLARREAPADEVCYNCHGFHRPAASDLVQLGVPK